MAADLLRVQTMKSPAKYVKKTGLLRTGISRERRNVKRLNIDILHHSSKIVNIFNIKTARIGFCDFVTDLKSELFNWHW